jgi:hypothetical protein
MDKVARECYVFDSQVSTPSGVVGVVPCQAFTDLTQMQGIVLYSIHRNIPHPAARSHSHGMGSDGASLGNGQWLIHRQPLVVLSSK